MTSRPGRNSVRGCVFALPPALALWIVLIAIIAIALAVS